VPEPPPSAGKTRDIGFALAEPDAARRNFDRAASTFASACFIHDRTRSILLERLALLHLDPGVILDLGCGIALGTHALRARYPRARILGLDWSLAMCRRAHADGVLALTADAMHLPVADGSADLIFANLVLPSCRPDVVFAEAARVLAPSGALLFATLGPETLREVRDAWWQAGDREIHVHGALDPQMIGDALGRAGLAEPVVDVERLTLRYASPDCLHADLRAIAGTNVAAGRRRALTGVRRWRRYVAALSGMAGEDGTVAVTCELIFGVAWGRTARVRASGEPGVQAVPIDSIRRRRLS
jgi:malonyl-CoA O-methyltransferase